MLLSQTTRDLVGADLRDLGEHRLKDISAPQHVYQLLTPGLDADFPPLRTLYQTNLPALEQLDAAELFIARARQADPAFEPTATVDALCDRLAGRPLAPESKLAPLEAQR